MNNEEKQMFKYLNSNGVEEEAELLMYLTLKEFNKDYIIFTKNEEDADGLVTLYSSELVSNADDSITLKDIDTPEEWTAIKQAMKSQIKEGQKLDQANN